MAKEKTERISLDTAKFVDCWIQYEQSRGGRKLLLDEFIPLLSKALDIPEDKIKRGSVQAKCYSLNNRAVKMGLLKKPVPGSGKSPGSGLPDVDWNEIYSQWGRELVSSTKKLLKEVSIIAGLFYCSLSSASSSG